MSNCTVLTFAPVHNQTKAKEEGAQVTEYFIPICCHTLTAPQPNKLFAQTMLQPSMCQSWWYIQSRQHKQLLLNYLKLPTWVVLVVDSCTQFKMNSLDSIFTCHTFPSCCSSSCCCSTSFIQRYKVVVLIVRVNDYWTPWNPKVVRCSGILDDYFQSEILKLLHWLHVTLVTIVYSVCSFWDCWAQILLVYTNLHSVLQISNFTWEFKMLVVLF